MGDLISRDEAAEKIRMLLRVASCEAIVHYNHGVGDALATIKNLPSAEKKGKWQWSEEMKCFICSECESGWREQPTLMGKPLYDWCPVCGADMRGEQE